MSEENINNRETDEIEPAEAGADTIETAPPRRFFTRRNAGIAFGLTAILAVLIVLLVMVSYRYGVFDNYIKQQFVAKMAEIGVVFEADVFRVTVNPLQLELKNATFNDKTTGNKLFFVREANLGLTVQNLYAWQFSRDITIDSTEINGAEVWVKFDENGKSNFSNLQLIEDEAGSRVNFKYDSVKFSLRDGLVHFGDVSRKISADAKNVSLFLEPTTYAVPDEQKRYNFDFTSTESNFVYDESTVAPIDIRARGIADALGAEINELKLTSPLGETVLSGTLTDWERFIYNLKIDSTVDLTQTATIFPLGTTLRGIGNFGGTVTGEGENYKIVGEINSDALSADNIYLKALNVAATVQGTNSMYEANGKAIAELLTFEDFRVEFPQIIGNVRGTGTDFKWVGELQAVAAKTPLGTLGGLFVSDAVAEYNDEQLSATLGNVRSGSFVSPDINVQNLQTQNVRITNKDGVTDVSAPSLRAGSVKTEDFTLQGVTASGVTVKDRADRIDATVGSLQVQTAQTEDARLRNLSASGVNVQRQNGVNNVTANEFRADSVDASGARIAGLNASGVTVRNTGDETVVFSDNLRVARVETDAAVLGSLNVAGVRLTVRQGTIEGTSGDIDAGNVALTESESLPDGGTLQNVRISRPVFVLEPSGRYRASADMSLGGGVLGSVTLGAARAGVTVNNEQVALNNLSADVLEGSLSGEATIALNNRSRSNVNVSFSGLDLGKLLALQGGRVIPIEGETTGQVNLSFNGTDFKTASGNLTADIAANAGTAERGLVPVSGRVELTAANGLFNVDTARLRTEKSEFNANGNFDLGGNDSNLTVALNSTDAGEIERIVRVLNLSPEIEQQIDSYQAQFAGNLTFNGTLTGNISDPTIDGRAALDSLSLRGRELGALQTGVFVSPDGIELRNGVLQEPADGGNLAFSVNIPNIGTNNISVQATLTNINTGNLIAALPVDFLPAQLRDFQAQTSGTVNLTGFPNAMQGEANITSGAGTINGEAFDGFNARATFAGNLINLERFEAKFGDGVLRADGTYQTDTTAFDFDVEGVNIQLARVRPFIPNSQDLPNINGTVDLTAKATGEASRASTYDINFNGTGRNITVDSRAFGEVAFQGNTVNQQLNATVTANLQGQQQQIVASVNFADENLPFRAETVFNQSELAPYIALVRPPEENDVQITGRATGRVFIEGNLSTIDAQGNRVFSTDNLSGAAQITELALQIGDTPLVATEPVSVRLTAQEIIIENARFAGGGSNVVVSGTKALTASGVNNLAIDGNINLSIFNALSRDAFFAGIANVSVRLTGPNETPRLNGVAELKNSSFAAFVGSERLTLERINGRILFTSNQAQIDTLTASLGGGRIVAEGGALLKGLELQRFRFNVTGNNFTAPLPPDFVTTGDARIEITGFREGGELNTLIAGSIQAKRTVYTKDIDLADVISNRRGDSSLSEGSSSGSFLGVTRLDISIEGRDALTVRNNVADLTASLSLRVTGDVDFPQVSGRVTATRGTVFFRGDRYEVQRGVLEFPPNTSIEPYINLQAETEIRGYQIVVNLTGELTNTENLSATLRSNPALPQADVVSLITTGNLSNSDSGIPTLAQSGINTAAEILTDTLINNPARRATDRLFGLNVFEIDPIISGQRLGASARLTVGRQINKNLLVTYSTNLSQDQNQVLALEYRVSNRLSFVAQYEQRSLSNVTQRNSNFSFEVRFRKRF
ncbi:MAG: translocation/assembly module TamB domain-containing protein [Pyrinomonadaceae bacterium]